MLFSEVGHSRGFLSENSYSLSGSGTGTSVPEKVWRGELFQVREAACSSGSCVYEMFVAGT